MASLLYKKYYCVEPGNYSYHVKIEGKQSDNWATHFLQGAASV